MDRFSRYCVGVGGTTRTDIVGVEQGFHATPRKRASGNSFKNLGAILGGTSRTNIVGVV